jgi:hypothetical protein
MTLSATFLSLASMTHLLCLPFLGFVVFYYILTTISRKSKLKFREVLKYYIILLSLLSPYITWRIFIDGLSLDRLLTYPVAWGTIKYGRITNAIFWYCPQPFTVDYYLQLFKSLHAHIFMPILFPFFVLGFIRINDKELIFSWIIALLSPYLVGRGVVGSSVYYYPFIPLAVILSAQGVFQLFTWSKSKKIKVAVLTIALCLLLVFSVNNYTNVRKNFEVKMSGYSSIIRDLKEFNTLIPNGSNILFRSREISPHLPYKNILMITKDLSEEDAIIYLDWQNDENVVRVLIKYNISYVILYKDIRLERDYHVWFKLIKGYSPNHYYRINESPYFEKVREGSKYILYKLNTSMLDSHQQEKLRTRSLCL